ncbi:MAG: hypothetical protein ABL967_16985 [Bryobacteraceae bacterium]
MLRILRTLAFMVMAAGLAGAQPALTTIQDILYRADGTRFSGTMFIRWSSFQTQDAANIATANLTLPIVNGVLRVRLAPTTTGTPGAQYSITYNSQGRTQFTETWAVPPSSLTLRVRDVRISQGSVVGPSPIVTPIQIGDVTGLSNALSVRPQQGVGFAIGRSAIINQAGQIEGAAGNLGDCIRVDGTSGACGGGSGILPGYADNEVPSGSMNGTNTVFTLAHVVSPAASLVLFRNGLLLKQSSDYVLNNATITFLSGSIPQSGDLLLANYRFADSTNPLSSLTAPQVICSNVGSTTSQTVSTQIGSCTIPAGLIGTGDRVEIRYRLGHTGTSTGFTGEVRWGSTTVLTRTASASEGAFAARVDMGIYAGAQSWESQSWGGALSLTAGAGTSTENSSANLTISFRANMAGTTSDSVTLRNFSVVRYPAQSNP